jgi:hypothetical protein
MDDKETLNSTKTIETSLDAVATELKALVKELKKSTATSKKVPVKSDLNLDIPKNFLKGIEESTAALSGFNKKLILMATSKMFQPEPEKAAIGKKNS